MNITFHVTDFNPSLYNLRDQPTRRIAPRVHPSVQCEGCNFGANNFICFKLFP